MNNLRNSEPWCGQFAAVVLHPIDDVPTMHVPGDDSDLPATRCLTLCGRPVRYDDALYMRADHAQKFCRPCRACLLVAVARGSVAVFP